MDMQPLTIKARTRLHPGALRGLLAAGSAFRNHTAGRTELEASQWGGATRIKLFTRLTWP